MANDIVFGLRADNANFLARRTYNDPTPAILGGTNKPTYDTDGTSLTGHNINLDLGSNNSRALTYAARGCLNTQGFSVIISAKSSVTAGNFSYFEAACGPSFPSNKITLYQATQNWNAIISNEVGAFATNGGTFYGTGPVTGQWNDYVWTWDGTTSAGQIKFWINGTNVGSLTASNAASNPRNSQNTDYFSLGAVDNALVARMKVQEFLVLNYPIDPSVGILLEDGTTSPLNGPSRTSLIKVVPFAGKPLYSLGRFANQ